MNTPHTARIWNYWLGGKDNFAADRAVGDQVTAAFPHMGRYAQLSRAFLTRAVSFLAGEAGVRQFLDIGTGLPTADNTHEVAQHVAPTSKIVYVDNDPLVLAHARALLTSSPEGTTAYLDADMHDPEAILALAGKTLDFDQPVALLMMGVLGHIEDDAEAKAVVDAFLRRLPAGSYFAMYDGADTIREITDNLSLWNDNVPLKYHLRSPARIAALFDGLELLEPGVVPVTRWRPDADADTEEIAQYAAVGRKP
ncbi:MAG TPA: SAM-dependent methyltransferase [Actinoplanes sp.]